MKKKVEAEEPAPKVVDIFERIRLARKMDKKQFAAYIGVPAGTLSQSLGKEWDSHWRIFHLLIPDLSALNYITEHDLQRPVPYDAEPDPRSVKTVQATDNQGRKKQNVR